MYRYFLSFLVLLAFYTQQQAYAQSNYYQGHATTTNGKPALAADASNALLPAAPNNLFRALPSGGCSSGVGIDGSGNVITTLCPGGGSALTTTDGTNAVTNTSQQTFGNGFVIGGAAGLATINSTVPFDNCTSGTCGTSGSAAISAADGSEEVLLGNHTQTLAQAGTTGFASGWAPLALLCTAGPCTVTTTISTFAPAAAGQTLTLQTGDLALVASDGTNYRTAVAHGAIPIGVASGGTGVTAAQGNGSKVQLSTGSTTTNDCVKFDSNGNTIDSGSACSSGGGTNVVSSIVTSELDCNNSNNICGAAGTTLTAIPGIALSLTGSKTYVCHGYFPSTSPSSGGSKMALATPDTLTVTSVSYSVVGYATAVLLGTSTTFGTGGGLSSANAITSYLNMDATVVVNAAGTLGVDFAQQTSNATSSKILINGYLSCVQQN